MKVYAVRSSVKLRQSLIEHLLGFVSVDKCERLKKFIFWQDLHRSLFADLLVRKIIVDTFDIFNKEIEFGVNEFGKPYCKNINNFYFNVSHSGDWIVCAVDKGSVGIDVEKISTVIDLGISENFFSNKEHDDLLSKIDPFDYFFTLWSLKESYIKFIGKGLSHPLNTFSMKLNNSKIYIESQNKILEDIYFKQYNIDKEYKMAVCGSNPDMPENVIMYNISKVIEPFLNLEINHNF